MCGIAGWANVNSQISDKAYIVKEMTDTLTKRGPDDSGIYSSFHVQLGHRRLIVVDPEGGAQPMIRRFGENTYTIVYNGELYNTEEIRSLLSAKGYSFNSYSDTEVLLVSYVEWGEDCVDYLNGIYAFGVWDEQNKSMFLARDRLGVKPLFYSVKEDSLIFASEIKALLKHPLIEPVLDKTGLMEIFGLGPARSLGSGVFKDINEIKPGHCLHYGTDGIRIREYWKLNSEPHTEDLDTTVEHVQSLVVDAIERQLVSDVPVCTFLSGGLDSSAISAIAADYYRRNNFGKLDTYSIDYIDNDKFFESNNFQPDSDSKWVKRMTKFIDSKHHDIIIDNIDLANALENAVKASDLPGMADVDSSLYLFAKEIKKDATVALSGECADEIFGGYPWYTRTEDINATTFPWAKSTRERESILSNDLKSLPLEQYVQSKYDETIKEVPRLHGEDKMQNRMRELYYLNLKWFMITLLNRKDRMTMANSLEVRVPYADHRIVEYAWNIPWEMKFADNREKGLLRRALRGILPDDVIDRKKSPYPKTHNPRYTQQVQKMMLAILNDSNSPVLQLIDIDKVTDIVKTGGASFGKPWFGQLMTGPQLIAYLIQIDIWMREYKVSIK